MADGVRETWKNSSKGKRGVVKFDRYGNLIHEVIAPGRTVMLSREERQINQERAASEKLDNFSNGVMVPVKLVDPEDEKEFAANPNILTEEGLRNLFKLQWKAFEKAIGEISNPYALERLNELAQTDDELNVTVKKANVVRDRLQEINPNMAQEVETIASPSRGDVTVYG